MSKRPFPIVTVTLEKIVGGGQTLATMDDGRKLFVWGGLPTEEVEVQLFRKKNSFAEGYVINVLKPAKDRIEALDPGSYVSTSPWQIMQFESEQKHKAALIKEAFELHGVTIPGDISIYTDGREFNYRNKMEFSWYWDAVPTARSLSKAATWLSKVSTRLHLQCAISYARTTQPAFHSRRS